jgi:hypothetical protein
MHPNDDFQPRTILLIVIFTCIYFFPWLLAKARGHNSSLAIFWVDFLLGFTVLGWFFCFIWACTGDTQRQKAAAMAQGVLLARSTAKEQAILEAGAPNVADAQIGASPGSNQRVKRTSGIGWVVIGIALICSFFLWRSDPSNPNSVAIASPSSSTDAEKQITATPAAVPIPEVPISDRPGPGEKSCVPDFTPTSLANIAGNVYTPESTTANIAEGLRSLKVDDDGDPEAVKDLLGTWSSPICIYQSDRIRVWLTASSLDMFIVHDAAKDHLTGTLFVEYRGLDLRALWATMDADESHPPLTGMPKFQRVPIFVNAVKHTIEFTPPDDSFFTDRGLIATGNGPSNSSEINNHIGAAIEATIEHLLTVYHADPRVRLQDEANESYLQDAERIEKQQAIQVTPQKRPEVIRNGVPILPRPSQ